MTCSQLEDAPPVTSMFSILQNSGPLRDWTGRVSTCVQLTMWQCAIFGIPLQANTTHGTGIADCIVCFICIAPNIQPTVLYPPVVCATDFRVLDGQIWDQFVTAHVFRFGHTFPSVKWGVHLSTTLWGSVIEHHDTPTTPLTATPSCENRFVGNSVKFCGVPPKAPKFLRGVGHMFCLTNFPRGIWNCLNNRDSENGVLKAVRHCYQIITKTSPTPQSTLRHPLTLPLPLETRTAESCTCKRSLKPNNHGRSGKCWGHALVSKTCAFSRHVNVSSFEEKTKNQARPNHKHCNTWCILRALC